MDNIDEWLARATVAVGIAVAISKEIRAWQDHKKKRKPRPRKFR